MGGSPKGPGAGHTHQSNPLHLDPDHAQALQTSQQGIDVGGVHKHARGHLEAQRGIGYNRHRVTG